MFKKIVWLWFSAKWKNAKDVEEYISGLVQGGATEFFTGYNPPYWHTKFGFEVSPNGRFAEHEQITDFETLKQIVLEVHKHGLELFINLNARYYTDEVFDLIKKMVSEFEEIWIDWIICGNISILEYLKEINYKWKINISTIMSLYNTESIRFFLENYKINKIILSREITLKEIEKLVSSFPEVKFEVFWEWDFCRYNNGLCFAEHKYWERDICTVVVNDLVVKKKFKPNFKKIILDKNISNEEKVDLLDDSYENIFEKIENILTKIEIFSEENDFLPLQKELEDSVKSGMKYLMEKTKRVGWDAKLKAEELAKFYARSDNLNLYTYLFFSKFKNIETVKFPTRWRNYNEKLAILEEVVNSAKVDEKYLDRGISLERAHYDLTYLFWEKLWFRKMLKSFLD